MLRIEKHGGGGPDLVILPGWGSDGHIFHALLPRLLENFTVHLGYWYKQQGSIFSERSRLERLSGLREIIGQQVPQKAHWVGWSLGGLLAVDFADHYPDRCLSLMTLTFNPCFVQQADWSSAMSSALFNQFTQEFSDAPEDTLQRFRALQALGARDRRSILNALQRSAATQITHEEQLSLLDLLRLDMRSAITRITVPQLHCYGEQDALMPTLQVVQLLRALGEQVQLKTYADASHLPFLTQSDPWLHDLRRWCL